MYKQSLYAILLHFTTSFSDEAKRNKARGYYKVHQKSDKLTKDYKCSYSNTAEEIEKIGHTSIKDAETKID